jgi:hypothetical protein
MEVKKFKSKYYSCCDGISEEVFGRMKWDYASQRSPMVAVSCTWWWIWPKDPTV